MAVCKAVQRGNLRAAQRTAYAVVIAQRAMRRQLGVYRSLIKTPRTANGFQFARVVFLFDMPLFPGSETTLLDRLSEIAADAFSAAYDAYLDGLPDEAEE